MNFETFFCRNKSKFFKNLKKWFGARVQQKKRWTNNVFYCFFFLLFHQLFNVGFLRDEFTSDLERLKIINETLGKKLPSSNQKCSVKQFKRSKMAKVQIKFKF